MMLWHATMLCNSKTVYNDIIGYPPVYPRSRLHHERAGHAGVSGVPGQHRVRTKGILSPLVRTLGDSSFMPVEESGVARSRITGAWLINQ